MSKKRTSSESNYDESQIQREGGDAKRAKLDPDSDTTLQDLPFELLEGILVKTVVMEVIGLKLAKSVWKEKADLVIRRLGPVCSLWSDVLTAKSFRTKLHRILDGTAQTFRVEILDDFSIRSRNTGITTLNDEEFLLYIQMDEHYIINVYDRDSMELKEVIRLPGTGAQLMTGCNVSNCVYICLRQGDSWDLEVLRISRDADHKFNVSPWLKDVTNMSVAANGSLITLSRGTGGNPDVVRIHNVDGSLQYEIKLPSDICPFDYRNVILKSNGNLVLAYVAVADDPISLVEVDMSGSVVRQFQSSFKPRGLINIYTDVADENDRVMLASPFDGFQLLDSEFNLLGVYSLSGYEGKTLLVMDLHYDRNRNEIACLHYDTSRHLTNFLTMFRFTED